MAMGMAMGMAMAIAMAMALAIAKIKLPLTVWRYGFVSLPHRFNPTQNIQRLINYTAC
jgi:hypothetical protein